MYLRALSFFLGSGFRTWGCLETAGRSMYPGAFESCLGLDLGLKGSARVQGSGLGLCVEGFGLGALFC